MKVRNHTKQQMQRIVNRWFSDNERCYQRAKGDRYDDIYWDSVIDGLEKVERWRRMFRVNRNIVGDLAYYFLSEYRDTIDEIIEPNCIGGVAMRSLIDVATWRQHRFIRRAMKNERLSNNAE